MSVDHLSGVFGDKFDNFVTNFEKSFRSTLMTLRLISDSSQNGEQLQGPGFRGSSSSITRSPDKLKDSACTSGASDGSESLHHKNSKEQHQTAAFQDSASMSLDRIEHSALLLVVQMAWNHFPVELILHDIQPEQQLACVSASTSSFNSGVNQTMLSTIEKSVMEQTRSNDLKTFEIGLIMKKLQLKERQLALNSDANLLERWKLSMGFSKASFKAEKFKTQLQDTREVELLRKCLDFLVAGLIMMLVSLAYGTYVYSHRRIVEATEVCSPFTEPKSWWMPKSMATFNSGLQLLRCQVQVFSRMLFGALMIGAIAVLLIQRSATSHQSMPVTVILLLLGVVCGYAGKFCVDMLGGSGNHWLIYWEALCLLHFFSNTFHSILYFILNGPITIAEKAERNPIFPYWMRRSMFYATLLVLPLLCGFMPFASLLEWFNHFSSRATDFMEYVDD
ncbi:UNVERIFIED_CONTAM: protein CPR-5 [Sesamum radiatum]|uniref:Protein CPR-5 n=1 Tax=Sesamum radiatum TaxID=300843 RepID=A0AAW2VS37_SESRA